MSEKKYGVTTRKRRLPDTYENQVRKKATRNTGIQSVVNTRQFGFIEGVEDARPQGSGRKR